MTVDRFAVRLNFATRTPNTIFSARAFDGFVIFVLKNGEAKRTIFLSLIRQQSYYAKNDRSSAMPENCEDSNFQGFVVGFF